MPNILQRHNPLLRQKAVPVALTDIKSARIQSIITDMKAAMYSQKDGIAIAAPQIGIPVCIFVISGSLLQKIDPTYKGPDHDLVFINPSLTRLSRDKKEMEEGCLSVRWLYGLVKRSTRVNISAYDQDGNILKRGASGILAQIFQHEIDHLDGILFIDRTKEIWEMTEEEISQIKKM
ncbi:MAG: peptide deformylase [Candidatus Taylorbacteria bacterium RIFCSPLOWO2_01_FULL_44_26]|uniref:Peptide deformylase n=2 Tax=Candidatus Tayloriibacteriota TaxID=1817919 RepID=A0A1G2ML03_9BACT|nr:MAG: peptide deformylase [Candidatus Taylorbacteria bacterium RIFCSPHIGHO2_02_FULL_44_12]OHA30688.1 MAG: peptide deformylase [Candidatus Taylorbacteria bacterium RIFCSPLOWO2_01_FULL_44_26]